MAKALPWRVIYPSNTGCNPLALLFVNTNEGVIRIRECESWNSEYEYSVSNIQMYSNNFEQFDSQGDTKKGYHCKFYQYVIQDYSVMMTIPSQ